MNALDRIAAAHAAPKTHAVVTTYADGATVRHETASLKQAENHAVGPRRYIGKNMIDRLTKQPVRVVSVEVVAL